MDDVQIASKTGPVAVPFRKPGIFQSLFSPVVIWEPSEMDFEGKDRISVDPFQIEVLGGKFVVKEFLTDAANGQGEIRDLVMQMAPDRWLVMVVDGADPPLDALTIIDDQLEFQNVALGSFEPEESLE